MALKRPPTNEISGYQLGIWLGYTIAIFMGACSAIVFASFIMMKAKFSSDYVMNIFISIMLITAGSAALYYYRRGIIFKEWIFIPAILAGYFTLVVTWFVQYFENVSNDVPVSAITGFSAGCCAVFFEILLVRFINIRALHNTTHEAKKEVEKEKKILEELKESENEFAN